MGWLIALLVLTILAILPLGVSARYDALGARVSVLIGPFRKTLFPGKKREKKPKPERKKQEKKKPEPKKEKTEAKGGSITDFLPLVRVCLDFLLDFRRKLRVNKLTLRLTLAGGDPCDLAVKYGKGQAILNGLIPQLERFFVIKRRDTEIGFDFVSDKTLIIARLDMTVTLGRLLSMGVRHGIHGLKEFLKIMNQRKGGVKT